MDQIQRYATIGAAVQLKALIAERMEIDAFLKELESGTKTLIEHSVNGNGNGNGRSAKPSAKQGHRYWTAAQRQQKSQAMKQVWAAKRNAVLRAQIAKSSPKRRHAA
jgi:hypothetical protein